MQKFLKIFNVNVIIAGLGYFVDMFDLAIIGVVRIPSLEDLGIPNEQIFDKGVMLFNLQVLGMLIGGVLWGILGDRRGRLSVLFGSIFLYSLANLLNGFITSYEQYMVLRFISGIGLAGELGAAVTLVSESLSKENRGYGTTFVATVGVAGAIAAALAGQIFPWQHLYIAGGIMGFLLLAARFTMVDSKMFDKAKTSAHRGDVKMLLTKKRFPLYLCCILAGIPVYFSNAVMLPFAPEIGQSLGVEGLEAGLALLAGTVGFTIGDLFSGLLSQFIKSRKKPMFIGLAFAFVFFLVQFMTSGLSQNEYYGLCFLFGMSVGYWAVLLSSAAEQFGTNIRSTVATSVPNFVRGSLIVLTLSFQFLRPSLGIKYAAFTIGVLVFIGAAIGIWKIKETFGKDLDFVEND